MTRPPSGEPYDLAGSRLVFANWHFIRPGGFSWLNERGENVMVAGSEPPGAARMELRDHPTGIRLAARPAQCRGPLLDCERPWEGKGVSLGTVIQERGRYRAWGSSDPSHPGERPSGRSCYFESEDGLHWQRPELGLAEFEGSRANNLLEAGPGTVFIDPSAPPEERYKAVNLETISHDDFERFRQQRPDGWEPRAFRDDVGHLYAIVGSVSPDGLRWTRLPDPLAVEHSDTQIVAYYDERLDRYVIYTRNYAIGPRSERFQQEGFRAWWGGDAYGIGRRSIGRTESADFRRFPVSEVILEPGPEVAPDDLFYTNGRTCIPGAPDLHLMFPAIWHTSTDQTSIALASSRDGRLWHFLPGSPVFHTAPAGEWDGGCLFAHPNLIELPNGDFALPYTGYNVPHKYPRGRWQFRPGYALWPRGRLVALEAAAQGSFATAAFYPPGRTLTINLETQPGGGLLIEVADLNGNPLPGRSFADIAPIRGDHRAAPATWGGQADLGHPDGAPVMLRFRMEKASLYALDFHQKR